MARWCSNKFLICFVAAFALSLAFLSFSYKSLPEHPQIQPPSQPIVAGSVTPGGNSNCALVFFGLAKKFEAVVLPSIRQFVLLPNPGCISFAVHSYNMTQTTNPRNNEFNAPIYPEEVRLLGARRVLLDRPDAVDSQRNVSFLIEHAGMERVSMISMMRQWHSIERGWAAMEAELHSMGLSRIGRVAFFRTDVVYTAPINVCDGNAAVIPSSPLEDRMFYGSWENAKVWATRRFDYTTAYLRNHSGLHSEAFLMSLLRYYSVPVTQLPVCFHRIRATGFIQKDCGSQLQYNWVVASSNVNQHPLLFLGLCALVVGVGCCCVRGPMPLHSFIAMRRDTVMPVVVFFLLVCQSSAAILIMRYTSVTPGEKQYVPATAVIMAEVMKTTISVAMVLGMFSHCLWAQWFKRESPSEPN